MSIFEVYGGFEHFANADANMDPDTDTDEWVTT